METIEELKEICGKQAFSYRERFYRRYSYYFTWVFLHLNLTANQVSVLGVIMGLCSAVLFSSNNYLLFMVGSILLFFSVMADQCDGEVARYRKYKGLPDEFLRNYGAFFDSLNHIARPMVFLCMSISFIHLSYHPLLILGIGFASALFCFLDIGFHSLLSSALHKKFTRGNSEFAMLVKHTVYSSLFTPFMLFASSLIDFLFNLRATFYLWLFFALCGLLVVSLGFIRSKWS